MKKLLILSSNYTGHGHQSIAQSLIEPMHMLGDMEVRVEDGFDLMGKTAVRASKLYGPITRNMEEMWKLFFVATQRSTRLATDSLEFLIHDRLLHLLRRWRPDAILSVHPVFNSCVLNLLHRYHLPLQFYTLIADLVDIHNNWVDSRTDKIYAPSQESYDYCLQNAIPERRLALCGFPVRAQFVEAAIAHPAADYHAGRPLEALIMSGGEGSGHMFQAAQILLHNFNAHVHVICGRNASLFKKMRDTLQAQFPDRLHIYGFLNDVERVMVQADVIIARGSPNTMMEAVTCNVPLIITGSLPGQEAHNPDYALRHELGIVSNGISGLKAAMDRLMYNEGALLNRIKASQRAFRSLTSARDIAADICATTTKKDFDFPNFRDYMPISDRAIRRFKRRFIPGRVKRR